MSPATAHRARRRATPRAVAVVGGLVLAGLGAGELRAAAPPGPDPVREAREGRYRVGPIWVSASGAARVRSHRAPGTQLAYVPPAHAPDAAHFFALAEFEARALPESAAPQPAQTIRTEAPDAWMRELTLPDLPVRWNRELVAYLRYFKDDPQGQAMMRAWFRRKGRYAPVIDRALEEVGVPGDLVYVALAESGFHPEVLSRVGAAGMWQFMEPTGRVYGLGSDYWIDDRRDFERSTYAAAAYLQDLRVRFGSWELALAAYNAGYGLVMQAIRRHNTNNFWALSEIESGLPHGTTRYVPKIVAAAIVGRNPAVFGVDEVPGELTADALVEVMAPAGVRIEDIAKAVEVDAGLLAEYNARYIRGRTPPEGGPWPVRIPKDTVPRFERAGPDLRAELQPFTTHALQWGEDLGAVAARFGVTERYLRNLNSVGDSAEVPGGTTLVVPRTPPGTEAAEVAGNPADPRPPLVAVPPLSPGSDQRLVFVRVTRATTQRALTEGLGVGWAELLRWNDLDPSARLLDGMWLQAVVPRNYDGRSRGVLVHEADQVEHVIRGSRRHLEAELDRRGMARRAHKVRKGETLAKIGKQYDLSVGSLARINGFDRNHRPDPGTLVIVYVEQGKTRGTVAAPPPVTTTLTAELAEVDEVSRGGRNPSTAESSRLPGGATSTDREAP